jgi:hypothetical protein
MCDPKVLVLRPRRGFSLDWLFLYTADIKPLIHFIPPARNPPDSVVSMSLRRAVRAEIPCNLAISIMGLKADDLSRFRIAARLRRTQA